MFRQLRHRQTNGAANSRVGANLTAPHLDSTVSNHSRIMPIVTKDNATEAFRFIAPVVKVALNGTPTLIGTAFFITRTGIVVTAKHVILDNIDKYSRDVGGIGILCTYGSHAGVYRSLKHSYWHSDADIAVSETSRFANENGEEILNDVLSLSVLPQSVDEPISTQFFHDPDLEPDQSILNEPGNPLVSWRFEFDLQFQASGPSTPNTDGDVKRFTPAARITRGRLTNYFPNGRDTVMLPFPAFESNMPIYAGASGGPVFNTQGKVIAINCTRFEGTDVAYHTDITCLLDLPVDNTVTESDQIPRARTIRELAELGFISVEGL